MSTQIPGAADVARKGTGKMSVRILMYRFASDSIAWVAAQWYVRVAIRPRTDPPCERPYLLPSSHPTQVADDLERGLAPNALDSGLHTGHVPLDFGLSVHSSAAWFGVRLPVSCRRLRSARRQGLFGIQGTAKCSDKVATASAPPFATVPLRQPRTHESRVSTPNPSYSSRPHGLASSRSR